MAIAASILNSSYYDSAAIIHSERKLPMPQDLPHLIQSLGYFGVWAIIFAESGLLIGFFLPGDSLLFTAGFLCSQDLLNIWILMIGCFVAAVAGDSVGYYTGRQFKSRLFKREDSWFFHKKHLVKAQKFYDQHGKKTIVLARFLPVIRTFAPIVAGMGSMHYPTFLTYNLLGGLLWTVTLPLLGYFLGRLIPDVDRYLLPVIVLIVVVSLLPSAWHLYRERRQQKKN
jgi:membrane-associated protein